VAADIRVAASDVTIAFSQSKLAIMPAWGGAERLAGIVGRPQALLLATTGERVYRLRRCGSACSTASGARQIYR
jgi:enoyl-CoA hydratase/carnithine racemase